MTTWANLLASLREELQDTGTGGANKRWSDSLLYSFTKDALYDISGWIPNLVVRKEIDGEDSMFRLPSDLIEIVSVECPLNTYLRERLVRAGSTYRDQSNATFYQLFSGYIKLNVENPGPIFVTYHAYHGIPVSETDTEFELTVNDADLELVKLYATAKVHSQMRAKTSRLDRFDPGSGRRDDNPLRPETNEMMMEYYMKLAERTGGSIVVLSRPKRR